MNLPNTIRQTLCVVALLTVIATAPAFGESPEAMRLIDEQLVEWLEQLEAQAGTAALTERTTPVAEAAQPALATRAAPTYTCLPTCQGNDGQFLSIAGNDLQTLADDAILLRILVPAGESTLELGIFDGDSGGVWDLIPRRTTVGVPLEYRLIADGDGDGVGPTVWQQSGFGLSDNAWDDFAVATTPDALTPAGNYRYLFVAQSTDFGVPMNWSNFKVRTSGVLTTSVTITPVAFAFTGPLFSGAEASILYPNAGVGDFTTTTYDGTWSFFLDVFSAPEELALWDGDFDRGAKNRPETYDTDDPDTPGAPFMPDWADIGSARPEGVAFVDVCGSERSATGCPADDRSTAGGFFHLRSPSVEFSVITPEGDVFQNPNPSGNREWEQFKLSTKPFDRSLMDYSRPALTPGIYEVRAEGVDLANLNSWRFFHSVLGVCEDGTPCKPPPRPLVLGDYVWLDGNRDGVQDPWEPGIGGVVVQLVDEMGNVIKTTTTDGAGGYDFGVEPGTYTVVVAPENFEPGGALAGGTSTIGTDQLIRTLVDANDWTYDLPYAFPPGEGTGTPGYWKNHPDAWPVDEITVGGVTYTQDEAIALLDAPGKGDKTYDLFRALVPAILNVLSGNDSSCIADTIVAADAWLTTYPLGSGVKGGLWNTSGGEDLLSTLDAYNNGLLCAPSRG